MHPLLKSYIPVAEIIAGTFGPNCEAVLHNLTQPENSVVYVANGTVTGRQVGQSFDHLVRQVLMNKNFGDDRAVNYLFDGPDGKKIRASSALIRDEAGEVIGMMCINVDATQELLLQQTLNTLLGTAAPAPLPAETEVNRDVASILDELIAHIIGPADVKNLTRKKCVELVRFMDEKGIFLVKGAVDKVAALMNVSRVTVYSYLDEARGKR